MGDVVTATGTIIEIGPVAAATVDTIAEFAALAGWKVIGLVESLGEYGDESSEVTFSSLGDGRVRKGKGTRNAGTLALTVGRDALDQGQQALIDAEKSPLKYAFRVTYPDEQTANGTGSIEYFRALVMSKRANVGNADNIIRRTFNLGIDSEILASAPT